MRKGQVCTITKIDSSLEPPDVTVRVNNTGQLIGTEFTKIEKVSPFLQKFPEFKSTIIMPVWQYFDS